MKPQWVTNKFRKCLRKGMQLYWKMRAAWESTCMRQSSNNWWRALIGSWTSCLWPRVTPNSLPKYFCKLVPNMLSASIGAKKYRTRRYWLLRRPFILGFGSPDLKFASALTWQSFQCKCPMVRKKQVNSNYLSARIMKIATKFAKPAIIMAISSQVFPLSTRINQFFMIAPHP
jgi:hypothetical protein